MSLRAESQQNYSDRREGVLPGAGTMTRCDRADSQATYFAMLNRPPRRSPAGEMSPTIRLAPSRMRTALITGVTGQDGSYLAEFLLSKGYRVVGMLRRLSLENYGRIEHLGDQLE